MLPGDVVTTTYINVKTDLGLFGYKAKEKGDLLVFVYLGTQKKGDPPFDVTGALESLGWKLEDTPAPTPD